MREARPGDVVVEVRCRCSGAVLVAQWAVADWRCGRCRRPATVGRRFRLDDQLHAVEVETTDAA